MCEFRHIQSVVAATHTEEEEWLEIYGTTCDGRVYFGMAAENTPARFEEVVVDLERQAAERQPPVATLTDYHLRCLRESQEMKLDRILEALEHSSSSLPSLAAPLAA